MYYQILYGKQLRSCQVSVREPKGELQGWGREGTRFLKIFVCAHAYGSKAMSNND